IWTSASGHFLSPPRVIQEEGVPDVTQPYGFVFAFVVLAVLVTAQLSRPTMLRDVALLMPVLFVSMTAARHTPFFAVVSAPYLAAHAPAAVGAIAARLRFSVRLPAFPPCVLSLRIAARCPRPRPSMADRHRERVIRALFGPEFTLSAARLTADERASACRQSVGGSR